LSNVLDSKLNYYVKKVSEGKQSLYDLGFKFCSGCQKFFKELGRKCPVCNRFLRYKPKGHAKTEYNKRHGVYDKAYYVDSKSREPLLLQNI
jgi:predicted amidophosphoribosyltransferase